MATGFGKEVGDYTISLNTILGQGTYGIVYKGARTKKKTDLVAAKYSKWQKLYVTEAADHEANLMKNIPPHDNIIKFIDFVKVDIKENGVQFVEMWLILEFSNLNDLSSFARRFLLEFPHKLDIMMQCSRGLHHLHSQTPAIVHRDIKPQNILVSGSKFHPIFKITDFGTSRLFECIPELKLKSMTAGMGTPNYMAPERFSDNPKYNETVDVYSFGVSSLTLLCSPPGEDLKAVKAEDKALGRLMFKTGASIEVNELKELPGDDMRMKQTKRVIGKMIEREPKSRPSAQKLVDAFTRLCSSNSDVWKTLRERDPTEPGHDLKNAMASLDLPVRPNDETLKAKPDGAEAKQEQMDACASASLTMIPRGVTLQFKTASTTPVSVETTEDKAVTVKAKTGTNFALLRRVHASIVNDDVKQLKACCGGKVDLEAKFTSDINPQHGGMTPLSLAAALNKPQLVKVLLTHGVDANTTFGLLSTTALMTAAYHGHKEVVQLLLDYGADVTMVDLQQSTVLGYAFGGTRNLEIVALLLRAGVDVNRKNMLEMNAILLVAGYGNHQLVKMILKAGVDPTSTNEFGHSPLHIAVFGKTDQVKKLKKQGVSEASTLERSLTMCNLDEAMKDWARQNKVNVGGKLQLALKRAAQFMMNIGQMLDDVDTEEDQADLEDIKRRFEVVFTYHQQKIEDFRKAKRSGILGAMLPRRGGKSNKHSETTEDVGATSYKYERYAPNDSQVIRMIEANTRILRMLIASSCEIDHTEKTFGMTALDMAMLYGDVESSALLVSHGADEQHLLKLCASQDLYQGIVNKDKKLIRDLLTYDTDLDVIHMPFSRFCVTGRVVGTEDMSDVGVTPLALATQTRDAAIIRMLRKHIEEAKK